VAGDSRVPIQSGPTVEARALFSSERFDLYVSKPARLFLLWGLFGLVDSGPPFPEQIHIFDWWSRRAPQPRRRRFVPHGPEAATKKRTGLAEFKDS
jgi:hypothetical protein